MFLCTFVLIYFSLPAKTKAEETGVFFEIKENVFFYDENTILHGEADSLLSCSQMCARRPNCKRANFEENRGKCSLLGEGQSELTPKLVKQDGSFYLEKVCCKHFP